MHITNDFFTAKTRMVIDNFLNDKDYLNNINYFPVKDYDTGNNMFDTIFEAAKDSNTIDEFIENISKSAKGNSGIILSQIITGFLEELIKENHTFDIQNINALFLNARNKAYSSVINPKEKTILTLINHLAYYEYTDNLSVNLKEALMEGIELCKDCKYGYDSGAVGLLLLINYYFDLGISFEKSINDGEIATEKLLYKYCTELTLKLFNKCAKASVINSINAYGDSINCILLKDRVLKIHIHNNDPYYIFSLCSNYGHILYRKIDNMDLEQKNNDTTVILDLNENEEIIYNLGVEYIVPTTNSNDYDLVLRKKIVSLNSKNIIFLTDRPEKYSEINKINYVKTKGFLSRVQTSLLFNSNIELRENIENMSIISKLVECIQIPESLVCAYEFVVGPNVNNYIKGINTKNYYALI